MTSTDERKIDERNIDEESITAQVESRLDDLFGEEGVFGMDEAPISAKPADGVRDDGRGTAGGAAPGGLTESQASLSDAVGAVRKVDADAIENSPIKDLKSTVLSLEWEITDPAMEKLEEEIRKLESLFGDDKVVLAFLQLLGSLGKYIRKNLARAHVDSITLLHSAYEGLEKVMLLEDMSESARKKMLIAHVTQYKKLKQEIQSEKKRVRSAMRPPAAPPEAPPAPDDRPFPPNAYSREIPSDFKDLSHMAREILYSMRELQQTIQNEFSILRSEMRHLLEEKK